MGYDIDRFVSTPPDFILCVICSQVAEKPVVGCSDEHLFCLECLEEWLKVSAVCPVDHQVLTSDDVKPAGNLFTRMLNSLRIKCSNYKYGCEFVSTVEEDTAHSAVCDVEAMSEPSQASCEEQLLFVQELIKAKKAMRNKKFTSQEIPTASADESSLPIQELNILM